MGIWIFKSIMDLFICCLFDWVYSASSALLGFCSRDIFHLIAMPSSGIAYPVVRTASLFQRVSALQLVCNASAVAFSAATCRAAAAAFIPHCDNFN